ncbi:protein RFT1 homolog [Mya arenaria]|uniref:protein RFT1 homolog n=1 Tax=Mya arenaria TaxID=6604 RepID=UPI0022E1FFAF|nr:protein RFT1 homolog [Mya arenaria]
MSSVQGRGDKCLLVGDDKHLLAGAVKNASYSMVLQLLSRMLTFALNAFVLRYISRDMLGVVNIRLTLLYSTTLFLATEAFDKACLSRLDTHNWSQVINLMWCTVPASLVVTGVLGWVWVNLLENPEPTLMPGYSVGVASFALATVLNCLSQPLFVLAQKHMFVKLKVFSQGIAEVCKSVLTVFLVIYFPSLGLYNFALAQVVYGVVISLVYYVYFIYYIVVYGKKDDTFPFTSVSQLFPTSTRDLPFIDPRQAWLTVSFFKQSFLKQLLTEGEKYVMTIFGVLTFADQGIYDIVNNLGSLAARLIFQPIEESGYLFFSQLLTHGQPRDKQKQDSCALAVDVLSCLLKLVVLTGAIILVFGMAYSYLALDLYGGGLLSTGTGPVLLRWYCLYVLVIALNGTTECFVFATMSKQEVDRYNQKMVVFSLLFLLSSLLLTSVCGSVGFILANCLNMAARIAHSIYYILQYFRGSKFKPLHDVIPHPAVIASLLAALIATLASERILCCDQGLVGRVLHVGVGGICLLAVLALVYLKETALVTFIKQQYNNWHKH